MAGLAAQRTDSRKRYRTLSPTCWLGGLEYATTGILSATGMEKKSFTKAQASGSIWNPGIQKKKEVYSHSAKDNEGEDNNRTEVA